MKRNRRGVGLTLLLMALCLGCKTPGPTVQSGNADRLIRRPDFEAARAGAKEWCRDALYTVSDLEAQIKELKAKE